MTTSFFKTPVGWLKIVTAETTVLEIDYIDQAENKLTPHGYAVEVIKQLQEYFAGQRKEFDLNLQRSAPEFTMKVWRALQDIPYGQVKTYQQVAQSLANPQAARAVGNACHVNPLAIVVPCHRVIGSSPKVGGYASGIDKKNWLIKHEQKFLS
jgi:methylated-DNA-[protein]-cysteine S-methyltransferase